MQIIIGNAQDVGTRERQEDYLASSDNNGIRLAVLADGMGGYEGGDQASITVAKTFLDFVGHRWDQYSQQSSVPDLLIDGLYQANSTLAGVKESTQSNMGSTLVALVMQSQHAWWISVGDSLLYLLRNGKLQRLNAEHSHYHDLRQKVFLGEISSEEAINDPERDGLTSALMGRQMKYVDVSRFGIDLEDGDCFLLASDGLDTLPADQIASTLRLNKEPQQIADSLIQQVGLAKNPHQDNVSVLVVKASGKTVRTVTDTSVETDTIGKEKSKWYLSPLVMLVSGGLIGLLMSLIINQMQSSELASTATITDTTESPLSPTKKQQDIGTVTDEPNQILIVDCDAEKDRALRACKDYSLNDIPSDVEVLDHCRNISKKIKKLCEEKNIAPVKVSSPQGQNPQGQNPQGQIPQGQIPQGQIPQGQIPQGQIPQGQNPQGQNPQGQNPQSK